MSKELGLISAVENNIRGGENFNIESVGTQATTLSVFKRGVQKTIVFPIYDNDGDPVPAAAGLDSEISKDAGAFTDCTNEASAISGGTGIYALTLTAAEMTADVVAVVTRSTTTASKDAVNIIYTT